VRIGGLLGLLLFAPVPMVGQRPVVVGDLARGLAAERRGELAEAATMFLATLEQRPTDGQAILGLSRVLPPLERRLELLDPLRRALAIDSSNIGFLALAVRHWSLLGEPDSAQGYVERWARLVEGEEEPFREWLLSALEAHDRPAARRAAEMARRRIAHPAALAPEMAQLKEAEGDIAGATEEWVLAVSHVPTLRAAAVLMLADLLGPQRDTALGVLQQSEGIEPIRLRALLLTRWGQPEAGVALLATVLPETSEATAFLLRPVLEDLKGRRDAAALRARAGALELQADRQEGTARVLTRMEAARAWADAGEEQQARRLLAVIASDPAAPAGVATSASSTLLGVLLAEGRPAEAESLLVSIRHALSLDERDREMRRVAMAWARAGDISRGEALLVADSSVAGFATRGLLLAFAGDLDAAAGWLMAAGPYDDDQGAAVQRVALLALIELMGRDSFPAFGDALLVLEQGDTVTAVTAFVGLAETLEPPGAAALRYLAGELALARTDTTTALDLLATADVAIAPATAPAARFARARIVAQRGDPVTAQRLLEELIVDFPDSAVVPAARRFRDGLRGAVPGGAAR
jgi:hypothetical protein